MTKRKPTRIACPYCEIFIGKNSLDAHLNQCVLEHQPKSRQSQLLERVIHSMSYAEALEAGRETEWRQHLYQMSRPV